MRTIAMRQAQQAAVAAALLIGDGVASYVVRKAEAARVELMSVSDDTIAKAAKIQAVVRGHAARVLRRDILAGKSAVVGQKRWDAAWRIQMWSRACMAKARVHFLRDKRQLLQRRQAAAVWVQALLRGGKARRRARDKRAEREFFRNRTEAQRRGKFGVASVVIERVWRGHVGRGLAQKR